MRSGCAALLTFGLLASPAQAADLSLALVGAPVPVFDTTRDGCDAGDMPDVNPRAYRDATGRTVMFALHAVNRPLRGADLDHLAIDCRVALGSPGDPDPSHYADRNFITATWTADGRTVSALVHHEYHADAHGRCRAVTDLGCWYNTILAYRSRDGGAEFTWGEPAVVAAAPFTQDIGQGRHRGFFNPSNIVADGGHAYVFISTTGWDGQPYGNCLMRTADPAASTGWRAFDGIGFTIRYTDPYRGGGGRAPPCATVAPFAFTVGSVTRHAATKQWVAVFQAAAGGAFPVNGFYYATARDLLHWGPPRLLLAGPTLYSDACKASPRLVNYPALLDPTSPSRNYDAVGDRAELFYTIIAVEGCRTGRRLLVRQPVTITASITATRP